jgi:hypothetical protein
MTASDAVDGSPPRQELLLPTRDGGDCFERQFMGELKPDQLGKSDRQFMRDPAIGNPDQAP